MKIFQCVLLSVFMGLSTSTFTQDADDFFQEVDVLIKGLLIDVANKKLKSLADESGYHLDEDVTYRSYALTNLLIPTNFTTGTVLFTGGISAIIFRAKSGVAFSLGTAFGVGATLFIQSTVSNVEKSNIGDTIELLLFKINGRYLFDFILSNDHYRTKLNYRVRHRDSEVILEGSCVYFLSIGEDYSLDYEIDDCSHDNIFPQKKEGSMRLGKEVNWHDKLFGQEFVVANDSVNLNDMLMLIFLEKANSKLIDSLEDTPLHNIVTDFINEDDKEGKVEEIKDNFVPDSVEDALNAVGGFFNKDSDKEK